MSKKILLIDTKTIKEDSIIEENVDSKLLKITLLNVQETILQPLLTEPLYDKILADIEGNTLSPDYRKMVLEYVHPVLIAGVVYHIADDLRYKFSQLGVNKEKAEKDETISHQEHATMKKEKERIMIFHNNRLQEYLEKNKSKFPEYESENEESEDGLDIGFYIG